VLPVISVVATVGLAFYSAMLDSRTKANEARTKDNQREIELANQFAKQKLEDSAFNIAVLHEVKDAIAEKADEKKQEAVAQFVQSLEPSKFQVAMANLLAHLAESPKAQAIARQTAFEGNTSLGTSTEAGSTSPRDWNYDVFYCEHPNKDENVKIAETVSYDLIKKKETEHLGRIRVRPLPDELRNTPPYDGLHGYIILRHLSKEAQAKQMQDWLNAAQNLPKFEFRDSDRRLPGYLSAFVCPDAK
jgi:hypothetical protein